MLRRPATTIKLTPEDVLDFDDSVALQKSRNETQIEQRQEQDKSHPHITFKEPSVLGRNERLGLNTGH